MNVVNYMNYYLVGIKGSGMAALACFLKSIGHNVIGSDTVNDYGFESKLKDLGIKILSFSKDNITSDYIYIISNAYKLDFMEVEEIIRNKYSYYYYHEFISSLSGIHIAVSGTHGKTTTTTFLKDMLIDEPIGYIIGDGTGGGIPNYKYLIYEACEYQDHFLVYNPNILVITNIDFDHPDYFKDINDVQKSFNKMKDKSTYVIELTSSDYEIIETTNKDTKFSYLGNIYKVNLVGSHLIKDLILVLKVLTKLGYDKDYIESHLDKLHLPKRRSEETKINNTILIEDYGHHPNEIDSLIEMIKLKYPNYLVTCIFQPHTYSRTICFYKEFIKSLEKFDKIYIDDVFTSKREPYDINKQNQINYLFNMFNRYEDIKKENINFDIEQIIVLLGAGDVHIRFKKMFINEKE